MIAKASEPLLADAALFGDYPWGNEPLELPSDYPKPRPGSRGSKRGASDAWFESHPEFRPSKSPAYRLWRNPDPKVLHWFRWITGHQIVFLFWRALATYLQELANPERDARKERATKRAADLLRGYTCMLLYSGSCTQELYRSTYRVFMSLHHQAFSGKWAYEYSQIPKLFGEALKGLKACGRNDLFEALVEVHRDNHLAHEAVAKYLVPDGPSLLQQSSTGQAQLLKTELRQMFFFDSFFLVKRTQTDQSNLLQALQRRVKVAMLDLHQNGLYPNNSKGRINKWNVGPDDAIIIRFYEENMVELLQEATRSAAHVL